MVQVIVAFALAMMLQTAASAAGDVANSQPAKPAAPAASGKPSPTKVTGTVTYLQKSALPPDAVLVVRLEDVSRAGAPALVLAENSIPFAGRQVPIPFELTFNPAAVVANHTYSVRATINVADHMVFTSARSYPVLTRGAPSKVTVVVNPLPTHAPNATVEGTRWKLTELGGKPLVALPDARDAYLLLQRSDHQLTGSSGCNPLTGTYSLSHAKLSFKPAGATSVACSESLQKRESALLDALKATDRYKIDRNTLELRHKKDVLARFEAQYPR